MYTMDDLTDMSPTQPVRLIRVIVVEGLAGDVLKQFNAVGAFLKVGEPKYGLSGSLRMEEVARTVAIVGDAE